MKKTLPARGTMRLTGLFFLSASAGLPAESFESHILPILEENCLDCHDSATTKGGLDLERFAAVADVMGDRSVWRSVYEKIESRQMPPPKQSSQPTDAERERMMDWIMHIAALPDPALGKQDPGRPVLRHLTRLEYNNTVRDLFGLDIDLFLLTERLPIKKDYFDPSLDRMPDTLKVETMEYGSKRPVVLTQASLPGDSRGEHGFTNRGDVMNVSPLRLENYIALAALLVDSPKLSQTKAFRELVEAPGASVDASQVVRERLAGFLPKAFRRSVTDDDVSRFVGVHEAVTAAGGGFEAGMKAAVQAVLSSPGFLYRAEGDGNRSDGVRALNGAELASRLSYFLWASMPDAALLDPQTQAGLTHPDQLEAHMRRMLKDARIRELSDSFAVQWLRLDQLYTAKPDPDLFRGFYSGPQGKNTAHASMLVEALLLFETVLIEDRSILDLIAPSWTWMNPQMQRIYATNPPSANGDESQRGRNRRETRNRNRGGDQVWQRVTLTDSNRGGIMTLAGTMTITSLPFRTSPVKRGAWVLETVFNRPPTEPKVAFAIENDTKEAAREMSIRQKFEAHRNKAACMSCHIRLDPPGFALERFDPIGRWRDTDGGQAVDAGSEWAGRAFDGPAAFKEIIMEDPREFTRGFIEHLLSYALGRKLEVTDMPAVHEIEEAVRADGYRFSSVTRGIIRSYPFTHTRETP